MFTRGILVLIIISSSAFSDAASIQKWVDENGKVHYGERPPERYQSNEVKEFLSIVNAQSKGSAVALYSTTWCGYCKQARAFMKKNNIDFREYDIEESAVANKTYRQKGGKGVPFLVMEDKTIQGFSTQRYELFFKHRMD